MTSTNSLLSRARAYLKNRAGRTALAVAPLATLGAVAAGSARGDTATFDPGATFTYGPDSNGTFQYDASGGGLEGSSLGKNYAGVTGATFDTGLGTGGVTFQDFSESEGGLAGTLGSIQMFKISGTGNGAFNPVNGSAQISYEFTLTGNGGDFASPASGAARPAASLNPFAPVISGGTLALSVVTSKGTFNDTVTLDASGTYSGTAVFPVSGTLQTYSAVLTVNYVNPQIDAGFGDSITATVPAATSIDFTAIPEPSTWLILATGVAGTGLKLMRVRQRRAKSAPTTA